MFGRALRLASRTFQSTRWATRGFASAAGSRFNEHVAGLLQETKDAGTFKSERVITSSQSNHITVSSGDEVINFCANNYLGLANHPRVVQAAKDTLDSHGFGLASVRFICGTQDIHKQLEQRLSAFHAMEDTILYPSCFDANAGLFEALLTDEDAVISDTLNHASIIDGIRLCKARRLRFDHMNMDDLEQKLKDSQDCRFRLIATDGVFSMDGDVAPLARICDLADQYDAMVFIDECHATGFFGPTGKGTDEHEGVRGRVDIINSTLGKAMGGGTGGYTSASSEVISLLRNKARPYLFSNSVAPSVVGASLEVLDILEESPDLVQKGHANTKRFREGMAKNGFKLLGDPSHAICPVLLGDARLAAEVADRMLELGVYVIGFSFPVVPHDTARIRVQVSAGHSEEDIDKAVAAFAQCKEEFNL